MAYAAVISLKQTIHRLLNSSRISVSSSIRETLEFAYKEVESLQQALKRLDDCSSRSTDELNALDGQMRAAVQKFEDLLEFQMINHSLSQSKSEGELREEIHSFVEKVEEMEEDYIRELVNPLTENEDENEDDVSISAGSGVNKMVGLSDEFSEIKSQVLQRIRPYDLGVFVFNGRVGTGRTLAAFLSYYELYMLGEESLDCGAWVSVGPNYEFKEILVNIVNQIINDPDESLISRGDAIELGEYLCANLKGRKYLIVLDDVRDQQIWEYLEGLFPEENNGSLVLLTTGPNEAILSVEHSYYEFSVFTDAKIWDILHLAVFGQDSCPPELEEAGKRIAGKCQGLYLTLLKVMLFLLKAEKNLECWNKLAADHENPIFTVSEELLEMSKIEEDMQSFGEGTFVKDASSFLDISTPAKEIKKQMFPKRYFPKMEIFSFFGMAGIGKTTLVKEIYEDTSILEFFEHRMWITLGQKYQSEELLVDIIAQIYPAKNCMKGDKQLAMDLGEQLSHKRCLIVLDDVWDIKLLHVLKKLLPNIRGKILMTTRLANVARSEKVDRVHEMRLLNKEESWCLLCQKVFFEELCPYELEKAGKKIAENCDGLPLTIVTVAHLLSEVEKTPECWNKVAEAKSSIFMNAYNQISKALLPSYKSLPQHLKACFLYLGAFLQNYEISRSHLIELWIADGYLEPNMSQTIEDYAANCLLELADKSLVMVCKKGTSFRIKTCRLHSVFWHLGNSEAAKSRFFHALDTFDSLEGMKSHRRLCVRNNVLLGIKDVRDSIASISTAHSLLCTGQPHQYPVPIDFELMLLRVMDALAVRLYEFPKDVTKKIHLRYLALTCYGDIPASISMLWSLQYLIVIRNQNIISSEKTSHLGNEIWDMKELKHLQIMGCSVPNPHNSDTLLPNLLTLLDMRAHNCTEEVLKRFPNLKRLGIQIELTPGDDGKSFYRFDHISLLNKLESFKCVVVNPELKYEVVAQPVYGLMFPSGLKKLSLSGLAYPWEYMSIIGELKNLEVLKLRCYAFRGLEWETNYYNFIQLKFLSIEDTDLVRWKLKIPSLPKLKSLIIKHCYKLQELPYDLTDNIEIIEVVDCSASAMTWAKQMEENNYKVHAYSS